MKITTTGTQQYSWPVANSCKVAGNWQVNTHLRYFPMLEVNHSDHVVVGVGNEQGFTLWTDAKSARFGKLRLLEWSVGVSDFASSSQSGAGLGLWINNLYLEGGQKILISQIKLCCSYAMTTLGSCTVSPFQR